MDHKRAEEVAVNRLQIISPMLDPALEKEKKSIPIGGIVRQHGTGNALNH